MDLKSAVKVDGVDSRFITLYSWSMSLTFGERLRKIREEKHITQTELSRISGVHNVNLSRYERGQQNPTADVLKRIAEALEISVGHLIEGAPDAVPASRLEDSELRAQLEEIERLPEEEKVTVKRFLDAFLYRQRVRSLST